jgi:hypothetical protein
MGKERLCFSENQDSNIHTSVWIGDICVILSDTTTYLETEMQSLHIDSNLNSYAT